MPAIRIAEFDVWKAGFANSTVTVKIAGTDTNATIYTDEALTLTAPNPQTLLSRQDNDVLYGKFQFPLYTDTAFYLLIDSTDETGIIRPALTALAGEDGSLETARRTGGSEDVTLASIVARTSNPLDFGVFLPTSNPDASAATNNNTLDDAISAVSAGGKVTLPSGIYAIEDVSLPTGVVLEGQGDGVTTLQSTSATNVVTIAGAHAGCRDMTLDGVSLEVGSVGVYMANGTETVLDRVTVKRFGTNLQARGGHGNRWRDLNLEAGTINAKLSGDTHTATDGAAFEDNEWSGACRTSVSIGVDLEYIDAVVKNNRLAVAFEDNAATALKIRGARYTDLRGSWFTGNSVNLDIDDFAGGTFENDNTVLGLWVTDFRMDAGAINMTGQLEDVVFDRGELAGVAITLTVPGHAVIARDVVEDSAVTLAGDGTKWLRWSTGDHGASSGTTSNATATKAWSIALEPGERVVLEATVIGNSRNTDESAEYHFIVSARKPPSTLDFDTQTANFTPGLIITGHTSNATGRLVAQTDAGATGTLKLRDISGTFVDNEIITDSSTGSATVNGALVAVNAALLSAVVDLLTPREDDATWAATFVANGPEIELRVTGAAGKTIEWLCDVVVVKT